MKHDLLRGGGTDDLREIAPMRVGPIRPADIVEAQPEQKGFQPELRILEGEARGIAGPTEIPDRFIVDGGHVHARQIAGAESAREVDGIAAIGLDLVAGLFRNQRWGDDLAEKSPRGEVAMPAVTTGPGFIRKDEMGRLRLEAPDQFVEVRLPRTDGPDKDGRIVTLPLCVRDGDRILVDVQTNKTRSRLWHS